MGSKLTSYVKRIFCMNHHAPHTSCIAHTSQLLSYTSYKPPIHHTPHFFMQQIHLKHLTPNTPHTPCTPHTLHTPHTPHT